MTKLMSKNYSAPRTNVLPAEAEELCTTSGGGTPPAVNGNGTGVNTGNTGGGGNAGNAHAKQFIPWSEEETDSYEE